MKKRKKKLKTIKNKEKKRLEAQRNKQEKIELSNKKAFILQEGQPLDNVGENASTKIKVYTKKKKK